MIPPPRVNMVRYYGVLSSHSSLRGEVVPRAPLPVVNPLLATANGQQLALAFGVGCNDTELVEHSTKRRPWAWLLRHVWQVDVSSKPKIGS